jgi:DNA-binding transcriptional ArsR family regulator
LFLLHKNDRSIITKERRKSNNTNLYYQIYWVSNKKHFLSTLPSNIDLKCKRIVTYTKPMDTIFKALADKSRRELLDQLYTRNGQTLSELCEDLSMTRQAVSKHLSILEEANLVAVIWNGRQKLHYLNTVPIGEIYDRWIRKFEQHRINALLELKKKHGEG